ncbi:MAG: hypothetical protein PW735_09095 [Acidobacteriaceae bacterium]|nr:hypothetical protein [Acidobacteriaceae bacterium]
MRLVIGGLEYTAAITAEGPLTVQRTLNAPSRCTAEIAVSSRLPMPVRKARVIVSRDDGTLLFTGYLATSPIRSYEGEGLSGAQYRARLSAISDEWTLDRASWGSNGTNEPLLMLSGRSLVEKLWSQLPANGLTLDESGAGTAQTGAIAIRQGTTFSAAAGEAAGAAYANYRAINGVLSVQSNGAAVHELSDGDGSLSVDELSVSEIRDLANDVTLSGELEPRAYVTECFLGDGTTDTFTLSNDAFRNTNRNLLEDRFDKASLDQTLWQVSDPGSALSLTGSGLTLNGGTGANGATLLAAQQNLEMSGTLLTELRSVVFGSASEGMLAGFYEGLFQSSDCFAGFHVKQQDAVTVVTPFLQGSEVGTTFTPLAGHKYTLRLRLHCAEMQRVMQRYHVMVDGSIEGFGALSGTDAAMDAVWEIVDEGVSSSTPATILYDSLHAGISIADTPAVCAFCAVNAISMYGSVAAISLQRPGSIWVSSLTPDGVLQTRLVGDAGEGVDCKAVYGTTAGSNGTISFFAGRIPVANERVMVSYRRSGRSIARLADSASIAEEAASGGSGTSRWLGKILRPAARSSEDCEAAAAALLAFASSRSAAIAGTYTMRNPSQDVWPGDVLSITSEEETVKVLVRNTEILDGACAPELLRYRIRFANDWATELADGAGMVVSEAVATDVEIPEAAEETDSAVLTNLQRLSVSSISASAVGVDAGNDAPSGGGFEVRRRDYAFGFGADTADLVLRSPVRGFSVPRAAQNESFFIRMYDGSTPPKYSRWSSVVTVHAPVG